MKKENKSITHINYPISIKKEIKDKYKIYCKINGYSVSGRIAALIELDLNGMVDTK